MNWRPSGELEALLNALADEMLSESDDARLADFLRGDAAARAHYRKWMALHSALTWDYAAAIPLAPETRNSNFKIRNSNFLAVAAALALLVAAGALLFHGGAGNSRDIVEVEEVSGSLSWTGPDGNVRLGLARGARLAAGNFQSDDETSTAVLKFSDGTRLTLGGGVDVLVADDGQKRVQLKSGTLGADVRPQPKTRPLLIRTPTASIEVLGTVFSVTAAPEGTTMSVQEGRVRFERLADGEKIDVAANHDVAATLDSGVPLVAKRSVMPPALWRADFSQPPPAGSRGEWVSASPDEPARVKAVPLAVGARNKARMIQYGISVRDNTQPNGVFVSVQAESLLHLRYRMAKPGSLLLFCITQRPGGAFGGNFELSLPPDAGTRSAEGWRTLEVPLSAMRPLQPERALQPAGNGISHFSVRTFRRDAGLEVAGMSIAPQ